MISDGSNHTPELFKPNLFLFMNDELCKHDSDDNMEKNRKKNVMVTKVPWKIRAT